jgi:ABC-type uncharacterized transport system permease subunit
MSKRTNTLLFILGATAFNIFVTLVTFILLLLVYARFLMNILPQESQVWILPVMFILAVAVSFFVYRYVIGIIIKKIDIEKYFDPIIKSYRPKKK